MKPTPTAHRDRLAEALHSVVAKEKPGHTDWIGCAENGPCAEDADALLEAGVLIDAAQVEAEALRKAADALREDWVKRGTHPGLQGCYSPGLEQWLRKRAERIARDTTADEEDPTDA